MIEPGYIDSVLRTIDDPEMPINIVDLGIVGDVRVSSPAGRAPGEFDVAVDILPTFVGCPALDMIRSLVVDKLRAAGASSVEVNFVYDPPWTVDRITPAGRESLRRFGVTVPDLGSRGTCSSSAPAAGPTLVPLGLPAAMDAVSCPLCGSEQTNLESRFGPTRCKMIYYCEACRNSFEHMRRV